MRALLALLASTGLTHCVNYGEKVEIDLKPGDTLIELHTPETECHHDYVLLWGTIPACYGLDF